MADFSKRYNKREGMVWPHREADNLRKAMRGLLALEKASRDRRDKSAAQTCMQDEP